MDDFSFVPSIRGKSKLALNGFLCRHQRSRGENHYFRCERNDCPGTATLRAVNYNDTNGKVDVGKSHVHEADDRRDQVLQMIGNIRKEAATSSLLPMTIVQQHRQNVDAEAAKILPSESALW
ncbi:unnamed protein product [Clavelina lepadiformis]|uniref:FLYWCH-type domain-containing protein n=1 Tax=Clavelina lepadiformis TaxID=159417 RepID=A0ABP0GIS2_CLALP